MMVSSRPVDSKPLPNASIHPPHQSPNLEVEEGIDNTINNEGWLIESIRPYQPPFVGYPSRGVVKSPVCMEMEP